MGERLDFLENWYPVQAELEVLNILGETEKVAAKLPLGAGGLISTG